MLRIIAWILVSAQEIVQADVIVVRKDKRDGDDVGAQVN